MAVALTIPEFNPERTDTEQYVLHKPDAVHISF